MPLRAPYPEDVDVKVDACTATAVFRVEEGFSYFEGHFPGNPIVPAVAQIGWALVAIESWRGAPLGEFRLSRFKFILPIRPGTNVRVALEKSESKYAYRLYADEALCCSGNINLVE